MWPLLLFFHFTLVIFDGYPQDRKKTKSSFAVGGIFSIFEMFPPKVKELIMLCKGAPSIQQKMHTFLIFGISLKVG